MNDSFAKLNLLDSASLNDVRRYSSHYPSTDDRDGYVTEYIGRDDIANADKWPYEHFSYHINDYGFREIEYKSNYPDEIDFGVFGCSFTFGVGLPEHMLWHNIISKKLNASILNFGMPAASIETIVDTFLIVSKHIKMKRAIFLLPSISRMQIAKKHPEADLINYINIMPNYNATVAEYFDINEDLIYRAIPEEEIYKICRNKLYLLDHIAQQRGIKLYISAWEQETYDLLKMLNLKSIILPQWISTSLEFAKSDLARDNKHPGPEHHKLFVDRIFNSIKCTI
jgi:hypothetical protein